MTQKEFRSQNGLSLCQFADLIGVSAAAACRYESGRIPCPRVLTRIIKETGGDVRFEDYAMGDQA